MSGENISICHIQTPAVNCINIRYLLSCKFLLLNNVSIIINQDYK